MKILVVDDEATLVKGIRFNLQAEGYQVLTGCTGTDAVRITRDEAPDLVVLDVMMPGMDGFAACKAIRDFSTVPIIILTAKSESGDKLDGFDCGADDYMTKPFEIPELKARIRALLRRSGAAQSDDSRTAGGISLNDGSRNAYKNGTRVDLTAKEYDLTAFLMAHPNQVFSREKLLELLWKGEKRADSRTVDVHIRRLREKLEENPAEPKHFLTKWSVGYYFRK